MSDNKSIADNIIDPTKYAQGIDKAVPGGFENIPEDWIMYTQLFVVPHHRSFLLQKDNKIVAGGVEEIKVAEIPYYGKMVDKNSSGRVIPFDIQTTEYTEMFGARTIPMTKGGSITSLGQESAFGITNISINFEDTTKPSVEISFVDTRGAALASYGYTSDVTKSPYAWFFSLPFPEFCLKIKGFYGKTISLPLVLVKFDMKYNNSTGNFDITCKFVGYPYSILNDINIKMLERLCCIPGGPEALKDAYNNLIKCLDETNIDDYIRLRDLPNPEYLCIKDYLRSFENKKIENPIHKFFTSATYTPKAFITKYKELIKNGNDLLTLVSDTNASSNTELYDKFIDYLSKSTQLETSFQEIFEKSTGTVTKDNNYNGIGGNGGNPKLSLTFETTEESVLEIKDFSEFITEKQIDNSLFGKITISTEQTLTTNQLSTTDPEPTIKKNVDTILTTLDGSNPTSIKSIFLNTTFTNGLKKIGTDTVSPIEKVINTLNYQYENRKKYLSGYLSYLCNWFSIKEPELIRRFPAPEKTRPSLQQMMTVIALNVEAFLRLLIKVSRDAEIYHEKNKSTESYKKYLKDANNKSTEDKKDDTNPSDLTNVKLYPWPKVYDTNIVTGRKEEVFPPTICKDFNDWPEIEFTRNVIDAIASNDCAQSETHLVLSSGGSNTSWLPLNVFEDAPFTFGKSINTSIVPVDSPYNNPIFNNYISTASDIQSPTIGSKEFALTQLITSRALVNLYYFNRFFDTNITKDDYIGYINKLAIRDAKIAVLTLDQCNTIELISNEFPDTEESVTKLMNFVNSDSFKGYKETKILNLPDNTSSVSLSMPYDLTFYLGNNDGTITPTQNLPRTASATIKDIFDTNFNSLTYLDKPQYPFEKYITVYLNDGTIITGFNYQTQYKDQILNTPSIKDVIYNYCPFTTLSNSIELPLGIKVSNIPEPTICRNYEYNLSDVKKITTYESFLNPSHIRDVETFNFDNNANLPSQLPTTLKPDTTEETKIASYGNGIPDVSPLFEDLNPIPLQYFDTDKEMMYINQLGIDSFLSYKKISSTDQIKDADINNDFQPINIYDNKTYYNGADPLLVNMSNTIRTYHTTFNNYGSDILKSFLWDPTKTKIGNPSNPIGTQEKSIYNIATNLSKPELRTFTITTKSNDVTEVKGSTDFLFRNEGLAGSYWGGNEINDDKVHDMGFQNTIFYASFNNIQHQFNDHVVELPILYGSSKNLSFIRYLFSNKQETSSTNALTTSKIPWDSYWINDFGGDGPVGIDYNGHTFTLKDMFYGEYPTKWFTKYSDLVKNESLDDSIMYEIPVDMNSTWFRSKTYLKGILPVKKYQTTTMKKMCYLIWKEATTRILKMGEIITPVLQKVPDITNTTWWTNNIIKYGSVKLIDNPSIRPGGPSIGVTDHVYPQSKFFNVNIDIYNNDNNYKFYDIKYKTGNFGYKIIPGQTFITSYPSENVTIPVVPFPNDDPTDNYTGPFLQPPLLTKTTADYVGLTADTTYWTKMYIHQTKWWEDMTTNVNLTSDEVKLMKTYLTLMSFWGANAMDSLVYNYPFMSPASGLYRVNNIDLLTVGAFLWAAQEKLLNGTDVSSIIQSSMDFNIYVNLVTLSGDTPTALVYKFGDPKKTFPFNVFFESNKYDYTVNKITFDRFLNYGLKCFVANNLTGYNYGETNYTDYTDGTDQQKWNMEWSINDSPVTVEITPFNLADDLKRDLINNFIRFCNISDFSRNIDDNLNSLTTLREVSELALGQVEQAVIGGESLERAYHRFPFDIEQTLLMWGDWASIVDLCETTKEFKSYYDSDDGYLVKRPEQGVILSSKLFDTLSFSTSDDDTVFDNPYKQIVSQIIDGETYYYSPWVRMRYNGGYQNDLLALKGDVGKKILLKLMKVISKEEQQSSYQSTITKRKNQFETSLNYKYYSDDTTTPGNDHNFFFESLFKGFYCMNLSGGMSSTLRSNYNFDSLGGYKLFFSKSWMDCQAPNWIKTSDEIFSSLNNSEVLQTYFKSFVKNIYNIKKDSANYLPCSTTDEKKVVKTHEIELSNDSLVYYRSSQNLVNRWVAGATEDDYVFSRSGCNNIVGTNLESCSRSLVQQIYIVDRVNRPSGDLVYLDPTDFVKKWNNNSDANVMGFISGILADHGYFYFEYPTFYNFGNSGVLVNEKDPGKAMWGMTTKVDELYAGPAIVIYTQKIDNAKVQSDLNDYVNEDTSSFPDDFLKEDSRGVIFKVGVGHENNNIFTNVQIDTTEFKETWEHIQVLTGIAEDHDNAKTKFMNQSLYNLWVTRSWTATVECFGNMMIQTGMYFWLDNMPIFGGLYIIKKVKHAIEPHTMKTTFWGTRVNNIAQPYAETNPVGFYFTCIEDKETVDTDTNPDPSISQQKETISLGGGNISLESTETLIKVFKDMETNGYYTKQPTTGYFISGTGWREFTKSIHYGTDIGNSKITDVVAFYDGVVYSVIKGNWSNWLNGATSGWLGPDRKSQNGGYGNTVKIKHEVIDNTGTKHIIYTQYSHLQTDSITVKEGTKVKAGEKIAEMGSTGTSSGLHLHFQMTYNSKTIMSSLILGGGSSPKRNDSYIGGTNIKF
jgi:hypothetical protein